MIIKYEQIEEAERVDCARTMHTGATHFSSCNSESASQECEDKDEDDEREEPSIHYCNKLTGNFEAMPNSIGSDPVRVGVMMQGASFHTGTDSNTSHNAKLTCSDVATHTCTHGIFTFTNVAASVVRLAFVPKMIFCKKEIMN